jgi:oxygen-independent coproporphyrinogen III oxidase
MSQVESQPVAAIVPTPSLEDRARPVPRYTSYPTAPHFNEGVTAETYGQWLSDLPADASLSLYLHVPYCDRLCWFCGCHTKQVQRYEPIARYLEALTAEISAVAARLAGRGTVTAVHLGGGSPSMMTPEDILALGTLLRRSFNFAPDAEISIEMDPNDMDEARYDALAAFGVTRASLGVQDFNPKVQQAINRLQSFEQTRGVVEAMRVRGVGSVNCDVLYGLPFQTAEFLNATVEQVLSLRPDRIALFGYAHVPWMKTHQKMIDEAALPGIQTRFESAQGAAALIVAAGYEAIGIDHFALPEDSLAIAARNGTLRRNFQGYTADNATALIGLGASSIGQLPQGYVQNTVATAEYQRRVLANGLATGKGYALTEDDRVRGYLIERLMCDFAVSRSDLRQRFGAAANPVLAEMQLAFANDVDGVLELDGDWFRISETGRPFVRSVAAAFDAHLNMNGARYSLAV